MSVSVSLPGPYPVLPLRPARRCIGPGLGPVGDPDSECVPARCNYFATRLLGTRLESENWSPISRAAMSCPPPPHPASATRTPRSAPERCHPGRRYAVHPTRRYSRWGMAVRGPYARALGRTCLLLFIRAGGYRPDRTDEVVGGQRMGAGAAEAITEQFFEDGEWLAKRLAVAAP